MNIEYITDHIKTFVASNIPEVLAVKGAWGSGKTYEWDNLITNNKDKCPWLSYSYVSLFGLKSIQDVREAVFFNTIDTEIIGDKPNLKARAKKFSSDFQDVKWPKILTQFTGSGFLKTMSTFSLSKVLICFDDLERYNGDIKEFLGLVSLLKEQQSCKIVLLLNEDSLGDLLTDYRKMNEKVIDKQLHFAPTAEYCFDTMFSHDFAFKNEVRKLCCQLNIVNRRVLQKIMHHVEVHLNVVKRFDKSIQNDVIKGVTTLTWCYYCHGADNNIPSLDYALQSRGRFTDPLRDNEIEKNENFEKQLEVINFTFPLEMLETLGKGITQGFPDKDVLTKIAQEMQNEVNVVRRSTRLGEAWSLYHNSFRDNESEIVLAFEEGLVEVIPFVTPSNFSHPINLLRNIGFGDKADELIEMFIDQRKDSPEIFDVDSFHSFPIEDDEFRERLREAHQKLVPEPTVDEILAMRRGTRGYDPEEADILARLSADDIYNLFTSKNFEGEDLYLDIKVFRLLSNSNKTLAENLQIALKKIAESSVLNKNRLAKFF